MTLEANLSTCQPVALQQPKSWLAWNYTQCYTSYSVRVCCCCCGCCCCGTDNPIFVLSSQLLIMFDFLSPLFIIDSNASFNNSKATHTSLYCVSVCVCVLHMVALLKTRGSLGWLQWKLFEWSELFELSSSSSGVLRRERIK